jgi:adenosylhomocysteine nucleosidase
MRGRPIATSSSAEMHNRSETVPPGPTLRNSRVAIAAPICTLATAPTTSSGAGARRAVDVERPTLASLPPVTALIVAALDLEMSHVPSGVEVLVTGVGKVRAAAALARRLAAGPRPEVVVNIGTAGAVVAVPPGPLDIGYVTEHDLPRDAIELLLGSSLPLGYRLPPSTPPEPVTELPAGGLVVATGDVFVADATSAARIAAGGAQLVDMEAYSYAAVCAAFDLPMRCVKIASDTADETAGASWLDAVDRCALELGRWLTTHLPSMTTVRS